MDRRKFLIGATAMTTLGVNGAARAARNITAKADGCKPDAAVEAPRHVENVADLRSLTQLSDGARISTVGFSTTAISMVPDGGGGEFVYRRHSSTPPNGGTVLQAAGDGIGRFHRIFNGPLNVRWFGAVGNGVVDDTAAIQMALDHISTRNGGNAYRNSPGQLIFPKAEYLIRKPLIIGGDNLIIDGMGSTITKNTDDAPSDTHRFLSADIPGGSVNPNVNAIFLTARRKLRFSKLMNFNLSGGGSARPTGIWAVGNENTFADIYMRDVSIGMHIPSMWASTLSHVIVRKPSRHGFFWDRSRTNGGKGQAGTSVSFVNCFAISPGGKGFYLQNLDYLAMMACACDGAMEEAYFFQGCNGISGNVAFERMNSTSVLPAIRMSAGSQGTLTIDSFDNGTFAKPAIRLTESKLVLSGRLRVDYKHFFDVSDNSVLDATGLAIDPISGEELDFSKFVAAKGGKILYSPRQSADRNYPTYLVDGNGVRIYSQQQGVSPDRGDADVTLSFSDSVRTQLFNTPLRTNRRIRLPFDSLANGAGYRIIRTAASTGAPSLDVGGLKSLGPGQWCDVEYDGKSWILTAAGAL